MKQITAVAVILAALVGGAFLFAQEPRPDAPQPPLTYRVEVNFVEVDAFVTDAQGAVVTGLTEKDFELLEDGRPQKISSFSPINIPIQRAERPLFSTQPVEADVQTNEHVEGRIYLIVLDDMHTAPERAPRVRAATRRFIEQNFGVNDLAAVVYTGGRANDSQDFTNNPRLLLAALDKFSGRKLRSATLQRLEGARTNPDTGRFGPGDDADEQERAYRARSAMSTIRKLADFMAGVRGRRKAMLLIGEGIDYDINQAVGQAGSTATSVLQDTHEAIAAATRGNVSIYTIDPRGLQSGGEDLIQSAFTLEDQGVGLGSAMNEQRLSQDGMRVLAANTGGFAAVNRNDLDGAFDRIVAENSSYYMLGFYPASDRRDGRFRKLEVRVKRPGLRVRSRSGYYEARGRAPAAAAAPATAAGANPALGETLNSPLPVAGLPLRVAAAPFKGPDNKAALAISIELDASKIPFVEKGGMFTEQVEVGFVANDVNGKSFPGDRHTLTLNLKADTYERAKARGLRVLTQHNVPPGRYQLRFAAATRAGVVGSVLYDIEVPDFYKTPLAMSGVAITSAAASQVSTIKPKDPLAEFLPGPVTATREFPRGDTVALFAEFYENERGGAAHMLEFKAELRADGGRVVRDVTETRSSSELQGKGGGYGFGPRFVLDVDPGVYVLHVQGQSRTGSLTTVSRDIQIRIK
jgi:VWFA-related protein